MPHYFSSHTTACLTRQALTHLIMQLLSSVEVKVQRCVSSQIGGRMLMECEASDQSTLERFLAARHITSEWIMRIDLDGHDGKVTEY